SDVPALLDGDLRHSRQGPTVLHQGRGVADDEYPPRIGNVQKWADACPTSPVGRRAEHLHNRRWRDACGPQYRTAVDPLSADRYASIIDVFDHRAGDYFHSEPRKSSGCLLRREFREARKYAFRAVVR